MGGERGIVYGVMGAQKLLSRCAGGIDKRTRAGTDTRSGAFCGIPLW